MTIPKMVHLPNFLEIRKSSCSELRGYHVCVELCFCQFLDEVGVERKIEKMRFFLLEPLHYVKKCDKIDKNGEKVR